MGEQTAPAHALPRASSSFQCCLPGTSARAFSSSETLQSLEGKLPRSACGCLLGQENLESPSLAPGYPTSRLGPALCFHFSGGFTSGLAALRPQAPTSRFGEPVSASPSDAGADTGQ